MPESISIQKTNQLKSIAILMMLCLHLFNRDYRGLFQPLLFLGEQPLSYYISLFSDACVPVFAFVSGYGLYYSYNSNQQSYLKKNIDRSKKLYIRYWIILFVFVVLVGLILGKEGYPGTWTKLAFSLTGLVPTYNGAWWYLTIYLLFIFTSRFWFILLDKLNPYYFILGLIFIYLLAFYFRVYKTNLFDNFVLHWMHSQGTLYFCTLFQFMLGAFALKYDWHAKVSHIFAIVKYRNLIASIGILCLIIFHGIVPNFIVAPFTALGFIFLFLQMNFGKWIDLGLDYFTPHSTNLWLIHMFFYAIYFEEIIYAPQNPTLIFIWLLFWCLIASVLVNLIYNKLKYFSK